MKVYIIRFLTLFTVMAGVFGSLPHAHAVDFGPIPGLEDESQADDNPDETPDEAVK